MVDVVEAESVPFVHLHTHTEYSLLDGAARIADLVATAKSHGQPALAVTDHGALYGAVKFYTAAKAAGVKPIIGCEMYMAPRSRHDKEGRTDRDPNHLILLARNETGYRNLIQLVSKSHLEGYYYKPRIDKELLGEHADGLICLSACIGGELPQAILSGDMDGAESVARQHMEMFGRDGYFLEIMDHAIAEEEAIRGGLQEIARRTGLPLVATNDAHYIGVDDAEAHDILLCIQTQARREDEKRFRFAGPHFSVTTGAEMRDRFAAYGEAVRNTLAVADLCTLELKLGGNLLPAYSPIPPGHTAETHLRELCDAGLRERYGEDITSEARERLAMELGVIETTGFAPYFLIVWDLIRAARCDGVVVGPGRGSSAGSLVAYVLRITNVCPLKYGLIFERFLNIERVQMPDIDIDFDDRRRDRVLQYVQGKYGEDRVAQIITFGTMAARAAIRDVGRALSVPLPDVDRLAKLVPMSVKITLDKALDESRELRALYDSEGWARQVIDNARRLEGICRNASTHAAGVVIGAEPLTNIVPLQRSTMGDRSTAVTMFDMDGVSAVGLLKVDFLGLTNLTVIEEALQMIEASTGTRIDIDQIPLDDAPTYALLSKADTHGVFQLEATFAKRILIDMQPRTLDDVALAGALNRPGPIEGGATAQYIKRKRGEQPVEYPVGLEELLRPVLGETHGTIVYQDQVMKIAQAVAGFTLGEADVLRAAMGKKDKAKMAKQRKKFLAGAAAKGVAEERAIELFDLIAFFAGYGFNKSHSVAYAFISYQTAYLKANHPIEFMAALLNSRGGDFDKLKQTILDAHAHGLVVHKPDINRSGAGFTVGDRATGEILFGLQHIKNVGNSVTEAVIAARDQDGPFSSLVDLCMRVESRDLNRRVLESLIQCGALDPLGDRHALLRQLDSVMDHAAAVRRERDLGQTSLFGDAIDIVGTLIPRAMIAGGGGDLEHGHGDDSWLAWERDLLGMYLSDHPLRRIAGALQERVDTSINELGAHLDGLIVQVGGCIRDVRAFVPRKSTTGQRMAFLQIEDLTGACEVVVFNRVFEEVAELLRPDAVVIIRGKVEIGRGASNGVDDEERESEPAKIRADAIFAIDDPRLVAWRRNSTVHFRLAPDQHHLVGPLHQAIAEHRGPAPVVIHVESAESIDDIALDDGFTVEPGPGLERTVEALLGGGAYRLETRRERAPEREVWGAGRRG
ncbi:MAG TPA: DNA polymerase III subunit alpha [Candidatus Dormibacteraeota bacterium]|nr:DNA polymerase III subunit alpha [Candidatus Dormibacteraeota bacterium]